MTRTISPTDRPNNLDRIETILHGLEKLGYFGPYIDIWFAYEQLSSEIQARYEYGNMLGASRFEPAVPGGFFKEIFSGTPKQSIRLLTTPYPIEIDICCAPAAWIDGQEIYKQCRLVTSFSMSYFLKLDGETNTYYIAQAPESKIDILSAEKPEDLVPVSGFNDDGIPLLCLDHLPFVKTCSPRFKEMMGLVDKAKLDSRIQGLPHELSDLLRKK